LRPIIGITCSSTVKGEVQSEYVLAKPYISAVERGGGIPIILPPLLDLVQQETWSLRTLCHGLLLSGGGDVDPALFNEQPHEKLGRVDRERDEWEIFLCRTAWLERMPILGICRGIQILNIALGGNLYQDISSALPKAFNHMQDIPAECLSHQVLIEKGSRLFSLLRKDRVWCNSLHHQAVKEVAPQLTVAARSEDGVIEAVEARTREAGEGFILGVQWHPERLKQSTTDLIFREFVASSSWLIDKSPPTQKIELGPMGIEAING